MGQRSRMLKQMTKVKINHKRSTFDNSPSDESVVSVIDVTQHLPGLRVPQADLPVLARGSQQQPAGRAVDAALVQGQDVDLPPVSAQHTVDLQRVNVTALVAAKSDS